jgi:hypothetical protein
MRPALPILLILAACSTVTAKGNAMSDCTKTIAPGESLQDALANVPDGAIVCLQAGKYPVNAVLQKSITLRGLGRASEVILDGGGRTSVLTVTGSAVTIEHLTIANGANKDGGGGIACKGDKATQLTLRDVVLRDNASDDFGGAALLVSRGLATIEGSRIEKNRGTHGAVSVADHGRLTLRHTQIEDNDAQSVLFARDYGELVLEHVAVAKNRAQAAIELFGTKIATPTVQVADSTITGALANDSRFPGQLTVTGSRLAGERRGAVTDGGGNHIEK